MSLNPFAFNRIFQGVLKYANEKYGKNNYSIKSYHIEAPCSAGENFMSEIYVINLNIQLKSTPNCQQSDVQHDEIICKSQLVNSGSENDSNRYVYNIVFLKEEQCYKDIMPRMSSLMTTLGEKHPALAPKMHTFYSEGEIYSCMMLDNLNLGFYNPNTQGSGMSLEECKSIMKAIARFHALSLVIEGEDGEPFPQKHEICAAEFFVSDQTAPTVKLIAEESYQAIIQLAEKYKPDLVPFMTKLREKESIWERLCKSVRPGASSFSCLCHGDARMNNIFLNREDLSMVRFIDFQLTRYASPLTDLHYIMKTGTTREFRQEHTSTVLQVYHEEFTRILEGFSPTINLLPEKQAAVEAWTLETLMREYEEMSMFGFIIAMTILPIILVRPEDIDNKSVGQMTKEERDKFWKEGRREMVFNLGCKREDFRKRLLDICEEQAALQQ